MKIPAPKIETVALDKLKGHPRNPKVGHGVDQIADSMKSFGYLNPIIVQAKTYKILAGHGRVEALRKLGATEVPVIVADVTDDQADLYLIADNRIAELSEYDFAKLADFLLEIDDRNLDTRLTGFNDYELAEMAEWVQLKDTPAPKCPTCKRPR